MRNHKKIWLTGAGCYLTALALANAYVYAGGTNRIVITITAFVAVGSVMRALGKSFT